MILDFDEIFEENDEFPEAVTMLIIILVLPFALLLLIRVIAITFKKIIFCL